MKPDEILSPERARLASATFTAKDAAATMTKALRPALGIGLESATKAVLGRSKVGGKPHPPKAPCGPRWRTT